MNNKSLLQAALEYASLGWKILPCLPKQKIPATPHGVKDATDDKEQIREWWSQWPDANIAVACGEPSGIYVIDVDVSEAGDVNGWDSLSQLAMEGKILPETVRQDTPRGGAHFFYRADDPPANKNSFLPGIDVRSTGYYVVVAPSIHPNGGQYEWAPTLSPNDHEFTNFPEFMRPQVQITFRGVPIVYEPTLGGSNSNTPDRQKEQPTRPLPRPSNDEVRSRASAYLATCDPAVQGQGGHDKLLWAATCLVHGFLMTNEQAYELLAQEYNPRCEPPWDLSAQKDYRDFSRKIKEARKLTPQQSPGWLVDNESYTAVGESELMSEEDIRKLIQNSLRRSASHEASVLLYDSETIADELDFLVRPTGLVGDICGWINSTAMKPQPFLTLGCVLTFCGALFGRKIKDAIGTRTNLYCMGVAESSAGKNHPLKQIRRLCLAAGCVDLLGGDDFASDTSIEARLEKHPSIVFLCDEIGHLLSAIKSGMNQHTMKIVSLLMKLYSAAGNVYSSREYADAEKRRVLVEPCCCLYGTSSPERFLEALSPEELNDGWLSRCLVFHSETNPPKRRGEAVHEKPVPDEIAKAVREWYVRNTAPDDTVGDIAKYVDCFSTGTTARLPTLLTALTSEETEEVFLAFEEEATQIARQAPDIASLWRKGEENARRIALIIAAGEQFNEPTIMPAIADYACRLVRYLLTDFTKRIPGITVGVVGKNKQKLLEKIEQAGVQGCARRELTRKSQWLHKREREALLADLIEAELVIAEFVSDKQLVFWTYQNYLIYKQHGN